MRRRPPRASSRGALGPSVSMLEMIGNRNAAVLPEPAAVLAGPASAQRLVSRVGASDRGREQGVGKEGRTSLRAGHEVAAVEDDRKAVLLHRGRAVVLGELDVGRQHLVQCNVGELSKARFRKGGNNVRGVKRQRGKPQSVGRWCPRPPSPNTQKHPQAPKRAGPLPSPNARLHKYLLDRLRHVAAGGLDGDVVVVVEVDARRHAREELGLEALVPRRGLSTTGDTPRRSSAAPAGPPPRAPTSPLLASNLRGARLDVSDGRLQASLRASPLARASPLRRPEPQLKSRGALAFRSVPSSRR